jgi:Uma2 family endonuclease
MVAIIPKLTQPIHHLTLAPGSRITIADVTAEEFAAILTELGEHRALRLTYYQNKLELRMPSEDHEVITRMIDAMISILCEELGLNLKTIGSTMLKSRSGAPEADNAYYIQNEPQVRGKTVDLTQDPPPDLVVEVDITHSDINKKELYQSMGIPEFWSYDGKRSLLTFYGLQDGVYQEQALSPTFSVIDRTTLKGFIDRCQQAGELPAKRWFRAWVQTSRLG